MRRHAFAWLALSSFGALLALLPAATRPRYGGSLTVQLAVGFPSLDPSLASTDVSIEHERQAIGGLAFETLVSINPSGEIESRLATGWRAMNGRRWRFVLRSKGVFHDGQPVTAASVIPSLQAALKSRYSDVTVTGSGQTVTVQSESDLGDLAAELSLPRNAIYRKGDNGELIGTGPFRLEKWEPGRKALFGAFEEHWAGRPYIDSVIVNLGPLPRQLATSGADLWELPINGSRRVVPDGIRIWASLPNELVALVAPNLDPQVLEALALSIDRSSIVNVLAQRRGDAAGGLLPQWLTGYAFLFPTAPDAARAKLLLARSRPAALTLSCPPDDGFARSVADRISLNARDAGLTVQFTTAVVADLRLVRLSLPSANAALDLQEIRAFLGLQRPSNTAEAGRPDTLYHSELELLGQHKIIPLVFLPAIYGIGPRVHDWDASQNGRAQAMHLESVWVSP